MRDGLKLMRILLLYLSISYIWSIAALPIGTTAQNTSAVWTSLDSPYPNAVFRDVDFLDASNGWVVGQLDFGVPADVVVLNTQDGGDSWAVKFNLTDSWVTGIRIVNEQTIWINGLGLLYYTADGGETWNSIRVVDGTSGLSPPEFINETHGWTSTGWHLYHTTNGGITWEQVPSWSFSDNIIMMQFVSSEEIWGMGHGGIYHSGDGGNSWESTSDEGGWAVSFIGPDNGWAIGDNRLAHTTDGAVWSELPVPSRSPLGRLQSPYCTDILFMDSNNGWIVGAEIPVMYTPDGGATWFEQSVPESVESVAPRIYAVDFISTTHGWAVGSDGTIIRTTNGNELGARLWFGSSDPLLVGILALISVTLVSAVGSVVWFRLRSGRSRTKEKNNNSEILIS